MSAQTDIASDKGAINMVLNLMSLAARTAPKSFGMDCLKLSITSEEERLKIAAMMRTIGEQKSAAITNENKSKSVKLDWNSDAEAIEKADGLLLLGIQGRKTPGVNCGGCGFLTCSEMLKAPRMEGKDFPGPLCMYRVIDIGIAVSSAVAVAAHHFLDNRIFQKVGIAALKLGYFNGYAPVLGIGVSSSGKNVFFDRKDKAIAASLGQVE
ncbi:Protein of unknown function DUF2148 [Moorella glycerini]|uniref:4Fe-4S domain-containing protein n=1 Tax=Neomoorella stamsii TaxID=1266720 RepID=A0A9X7J2Q9_9FIRM|nr:MULTISPECIES: DUF2148 domain-containing protein [Moorella]PRR71509.1 hypothetical protein MOST_25650 [Moorella stamsii]CEP68720.1 Protein of unknown function DUF2148 [Moorella glycerini]